MALFKKKDKKAKVAGDLPKGSAVSKKNMKKQKAKKEVLSPNKEADKNKKNDQKPKEVKKIKIKEKDSGKRLKTRVMIILGINIVGIITLVVFLGKLPTKAKELKGLKNSILTAEQSVEVNFADLELKSNKEVAEKLLALYPDEVGLVNFVQEIEKLKKQGIVTKFSFANQTPVRDKTKYLGIPVAIEIKGNWKEISGVLVDLQEMSYIFRPVSLSTQPDSEEGLIKVRYGGFLYVDESFEEK